MSPHQSVFRIDFFDADIQIPETRVASSPSFSRPAARAPRRACSQAITKGEI